MIIKVSVPESTLKSFEGKNGDIYYKISLAKAYKNKNDEWVNSDVFLSKAAYDAIKENDKDTVFKFSGKNNLETI